MTKSTNKNHHVEPYRHFLFLQGLRSPFFWRLANALRATGARVTKLHFTVGDHLYWRGPALRCRVEEPALPGYFGSLVSSADITDVVLFGDCRPVHQPAIQVARALGLPVHVFEEGYFRPDWVTLERNGVNGHSDLPADLSWYQQVQKAIPALPPPSEVGPSMTRRVLHDIAYNAGNLFNPVAYPNYRSHVPHSIPAEYLSYARRFIQVRAHRAKDHQTIDLLCQANSKPFFLVALQVPGDSQLTVHSRFSHSAEFLREVFESFSRHAEKDCWLVVKSHPLDPGLQPTRTLVHRLAQAHGCAGRTAFLDSGNLPRLLDHARGLVTINSTSIGQALFHRCPTIALGRSIFGMPGLTFSGTLDAFWRNATSPEHTLYNAFHRVVVHATQINGGLYTDRGMSLAVANAVPNLLAEKSKLQCLLEQHPCNTGSG